MEGGLSPPSPHLDSPWGFQRVPFSANLTISLCFQPCLFSLTPQQIPYGGKKPRSVDAWWPGTFNFSQLGDSVGDTMALGELGF